MAKYLKINGNVCLDTWQCMFRYLARYVLLLPPYHLVDDAYIALDNLHYLGADVFIYIVWDRDTVVAIFAEFYGGIYSL